MRAILGALLAVTSGCLPEPTPASCPWEGVYTIDEVSCDGVVMEQFIALPRPYVSWSVGEHGCEVDIELQRIEDDLSCEVSETIELAGEPEWEGRSLGGSDSPAGCFGSGGVALELGKVDVEALPDGVSVTFSTKVPWSLSECEGKPTVLFGVP